MFKLWVWEKGRWFIHSTYRTSNQAKLAGKTWAMLNGYTFLTWTVAKEGSQEHEHMIKNHTDYKAPMT